VRDWIIDIILCPGGFQLGALCVKSLFPHGGGGELTCVALSPGLAKH